MTPRVYGWLTVVGPAAGRRWQVRCQCGVVLFVVARQLGGHRGLRGCGTCGVPPAVAMPRDWRGASGSPEYRSWSAMRRRCADRDDVDYGGRGIAVCARWAADFHAFVEDIGPRPPGTTLDRIDVDGGYWCGRADCLACGPAQRPCNVRWATAKTQARNTRANRQVTAFGTTLCLAAWSDVYGIPASTIAHRLDDGWLPESAVSTPP